MDAVELHPWGSTVDDIEPPDQMIFDLDPSRRIEWGFVIETALQLREFLQAEGFRAMAEDHWRQGAAPHGAARPVPRCQ